MEDGVQTFRDPYETRRMPLRRSPRRADPRLASRVGGRRGTSCAGVRLLARVTGNRLRPFPSAPLRTVHATFTAHGSPVVDVPADDGRGWLGVPHVAYLPVPAIRPPAPLRHVAGSPGRGLLRRLRRRGVRAR